jgi:hypothetical protein
MQSRSDDEARDELAEAAGLTTPEHGGRTTSG